MERVSTRHNSTYPVKGHIMEVKRLFWSLLEGTSLVTLPKYQQFSLALNLLK